MKRWLAFTLLLAACGHLDSDPTAADFSPTESRPDHTLVNLAHSLIHELDLNDDGRLSLQERAASPGLAVLEEDFRFGNREAMNAQQLTVFLNRSLKAATDRMHSEPQKASPKTPVLLVQGWGEPSWSLLYGIYRQLKQAGYPVYGINLFPNATDIDVQAKKVKDFSLKILEETGAKRLNLVAHSMGGLISRSFVQKMNGDQWVDNIITISTPHTGTYVAYLGPGQGAKQMHPGSPYLKDLNRRIHWPPVKIHCIWSPHDEFVVPQKNAQLRDTHVFPGIPFTGHGTILFSERTYRQIAEVLP